MTNIAWIAINLYNWAKDGIESIVQGQNLLENIYLSRYIKWILWTDGLWIIFALIFMLRRKHYKTDSLLHYLQHSKISTPSICIIIPTYNESLSIEKVIKDFQNQQFVRSIIVIDNNSNDQTADIAEKCGVNVIRKNVNKGYAHSFVLGLKESLKTNANIIATTEADGTYNAYDLEKMVPYLDNCDMVVGTRQNQVITEKGNQNSLLHVWGNFLLAKLIQIKYFSLLHMGIVNLTDVGCVYRVMKRKALEKIVEHLTYPNTDEAVGGIGIGLYLTMLGIENDLRIIEVPVTFNKRIGISKLEPKKLHAIKIGLKFLWLILRV
jgi:glycosyltransferase involved in cell wall biosynthesis